MRSIMDAERAIRCGDASIILAGGMEQGFPFLKISHFLERIQIEHIGMKNNLDSKLQIYSTCSIRIRLENWGA